MNEIIAIAAREIRSQFLTPSGWVILAVNAAILAYMLLIQLERFVALQAQLSTLPSAPGATELVIVPLFKSAGFIFLITMPLVTMNLIAEERRQRTFVLLLSSAISSTQIVLGKYLGLCVYLMCLLALAAVLALSLTLGGQLDVGRLLSGLLALALLLGAMGAIGLLMSALNQLPSVAAFATFGLLLALWMLGWGDGSNPDSVLSHLSVAAHFNQMLTGVVHTRDVIYFVLLITGALLLGIQRLRLDTR